MVTLITEKLQNQRLDDLSRRVLQAGPYSAEKLNRSGHLFPLEVGGDKSPWPALRGGPPIGSPGATGSACPFLPAPCAVAHADGVQWRPESPGPCPGPGSTLDLCENTGPPVAPPTKRHCRSLSEPEELARCRSPWRPSGSKVWTPVSKRRCNSGGSATLRRGGGGSLGSLGLPRSPTSPLAPRPASPSSGGVESSEGGLASAPRCPEQPGWLSRRRLSLSQEHLADTGAHLLSASSTPTSTPELGRRHGLPRCRSQPCVLSGRRRRRKRQREGARWTRPSLDFLKMTRTLKNSKSLCSLDYEDDDEDDTQAKTVVSSPCDSQDLAGLVTPSPSPGLWTPREQAAGRREGRGSGDWGSAGEEGALPRDSSDLDLEQIENN
ncbi:protein FAM53A isoform X1 [Dipodomys merriami]|uniref:protein FAM53A isoform X1 n=1 Tax=Dipodomys merriami TaxID=94247 RepID=UPI00385592C8